MKGFELYNGNTDIRVVDGGRTVLTTEGMLINLLPPAYNLSINFNVVFPDFSKDYLYNWQHGFSYTNPGTSDEDYVGYDSYCSTALTIPAQDFGQEDNIAAAPNGSDIFVGSVIISRTVAPTHTWAGTNIDPLQPMGVRIPIINGSLLMEAEFGMARAFSLYVSGGFLKLHRQQSVSTPPEGWGQYGNSFEWNNPGSGGGGENVNGGSKGIPVVIVDGKNVDSYFMPVDFYPPVPVYDERTRRGGPNACALPNYSSYNFGSTYNVQLTGAFGRRS